MITIKKGLDIPVKGAPQQVIHDGSTIKTVAALGEEFVGMRPTMFVRVGDSVKKGQALLVSGLFSYKKETTYDFSTNRTSKKGFT